VSLLSCQVVSCSSVNALIRVNIPFFNFEHLSTHPLFYPLLIAQVFPLPLIVSTVGNACSISNCDCFCFSIFLKMQKFLKLSKPIEDPLKFLHMVIIIITIN